MNGFLIIDKPAGISSFDVVRKVRRWTHVRRVGHAGTLDPLATGVLPVAVGRATRLIEYLMAGDKVYQATLKLGAVTDTQDAEGQVLEEKDWSQVDAAALEAAVDEFRGEIEQLPPMYSALKKDGQPLYKLARLGVEVERKPRAVTILSLDIDRVEFPLVTFTVKCSKGTYVRTLCHDVGRQLGCGAHMTALRRLACGSFSLDDSVTMEQLQQLADQDEPLPLLAPADALADWQALPVAGPVRQRLQNGVAPAHDEIPGCHLSSGERVKFLADGELLALASYRPDGGGKGHGDFELLKVFPLEKEG